MASTVTRLSDVIVPSVFNNYVINATAEKSALIQSGIAASDPRIEIPSGGDTINMPFFNDLSGDAQPIQSNSALDTNKIGTGKDVARLLLYGNAWSSEDLAAELAGEDPMQAIANRVVAYWDRELQKVLIKELNGVFADNSNNDSGDLIKDVANEDVDTNGAVNLDGDVILDGKQLLGDSKGMLTAIGMHSQVHTNLQKKQLIQYDPEADADIGFGTYLGHTVVVDDSCPVEAAATSGQKYTSYLFGSGAIGYEEDTPFKLPATETDRNTLKGEDILINRKKFIMHPRGIKWTEGSVAGDMPTYAELADALNWDRVYDKKKIRVVKLVTNG